MYIITYIFLIIYIYIYTYFTYLLSIIFSTSSKNVQHTLGHVQAAGLDGSVRRHSAAECWFVSVRNVLEEWRSEEIYRIYPLYTHFYSWILMKLDHVVDPFLR